MTYILYISYDGMLEPLGQSQVLAYLKRLANGRRIHLISFEKADDWANVAERVRLARDIASAGIAWHPLRYHKTPSVLATAFDIMQGIIVGVWLCVRYKIKIIHARSYIPSVIALTLKKLFNVKYIFDMRGFWADERIDGGLWPKGGRIYRVAKWFEKRFLLSADSVVSLTNAAVDEMKKFDYLQGRLPNFKVITTCTDLNLFDFKKTNINNSSKESFVLGYVGSVGVWYLFDETLNCFKLILEKVPSAQLHIINRGGHQYIRERLIDKRINPNNVMIETSDHAGVAKAMQSMDVGIFFIKPVYSKMSSAPTKLGEFLGCGIPCLSNTKVGDMAVILNDEKVGVALDSFDETSMKLGIEELMTLLNDPEIRERCRSTALKYFSLDIGVRSYNHIYNRLIS